MLPRSERRRPFLRRSWIFASLCLSAAIALALGAAWHVHRRGQSLSTAQARLVEQRTWHAALESRAAEEDRLAPSFRGFEAKGLIRREGEGEWLEEMRLALASEPIFLSPVIVGDEEAHERGKESGDRQGVRVERVDAGVERRFVHEEELFAFFRRLRSKVGLPVSVTRCRVVRKAPSDIAVVPGEDIDRQEPPLAPDPLLEVSCRLRWTRVVIAHPDPARRPPGVRQAAFEAGSFSIETIPASDIDSVLDPILPALPLDAFDRLLTTRKERDRLDRMRLSSALAMIRKVDSALPEPAQEPVASIEPAFEPHDYALEPPDPVFEPPDPEASSLDESIVEAPVFRPRRFGGIIARSGDPRWIWIDGQRFEVDLLPSDAIAITDPYPAIRVRVGDRWVELLPGQAIDPITGNPSAPLVPDGLYRGRASGD